MPCRLGSDLEEEARSDRQGTAEGERPQLPVHVRQEGRRKETSVRGTGLRIKESHGDASGLEESTQSKMALSETFLRGPGEDFPQELTVRMDQELIHASQAKGPVRILRRRFSGRQPAIIDIRL